MPRVCVHSLGGSGAVYAGPLLHHHLLLRHLHVRRGAVPHSRPLVRHGHVHLARSYRQPPGPLPGRPGQCLAPTSPYLALTWPLPGPLPGPYLAPYLAPTWPLPGHYLAPTWPYLTPTWPLPGPLPGRPGPPWPLPGPYLADLVSTY